MTQKLKIFEINNFSIFQSKKIVLKLEVVNKFRKLARMKEEFETHNELKLKFPLI